MKTFFDIGRNFMFFAVYLDLDHGIESVGPGRLLAFAGEHLQQFAQLDFKDPKLNLQIEIDFWRLKSLLSVYLIMDPSRALF